MSTKHLRALVETARYAAARHPLKDEVLGIIGQAEAELVAIEMAAKDFSVNGDEAHSETSWGLMDSIAKESP